MDGWMEWNATSITTTTPLLLADQHLLPRRPTDMSGLSSNDDQHMTVPQLLFKYRLCVFII
jgi:hypothetical protein